MGGDVMDFPDRIWVEEPEVFDHMGFWQEEQSAGLTEYVRADLFAALLKQIDDCAMYLKPGETPRQRMDRDFGDVQALLQLLEKEKRKNQEKL